jgi:hypothetical protein
MPADSSESRISGATAVGRCDIDNRPAANSGPSYVPGSRGGGGAVATAQKESAAAAGESLAAGRPRLAGYLSRRRLAGYLSRRRLAGYLSRAVDLVRRHPVFAVALTLAAALRAAVMIGFQPIFWFTDSAAYLGSALDHTLSTARPGGYSVFLAILEPFRSFLLVALLQHLMGLGTGVAIYALLRRRGLPGWGATLAALPVLFDAYELQLEHLLMPDTLFIAAVTLVIVLLCWNDQLSVRTAAVAGLLLGFAAVVRSVGVPLLAVIAVCLLARKVGWRPIAALVAACALPVVLYMGEFYFQHKQFAITESTGVFLYDRVMDFASCSVIKPPSSLAVLCDPRPQSKREQPPIEYIWGRHDPIYRLTEHPATVINLFKTTDPSKVLYPNRFSTDIFTPRINKLAEKFAERAILAQPGDYIRVVASDTLRSFYWGSPIPYDRSNVQYLFNDRFHFDRSWLREMRYYEPHMAKPHVVQPFANFLIAYQRWIYVRGTMVGLILLIGLAGIVAKWRRRGGLVLLPWAVAVLLVILPPLTVGFNSRYVLAAVPCACLAAGLAAIRQRSAATTAVSRTETAADRTGDIGAAAD